ncbi:hypothetical protein GUITHDRAFT_138566 [Guillardia theta CCMP2712]|uniref:Apple domain-containing protein n=1 Tax=Guillardia theta (strain CCMP2712) TaxID=905079 RepID=L1JCP1_GUITC|nr:hypothetical protein GUITHDRAFT_138566 [Guillardia theta CCMP2712]EKX46092.1 hypothetical protein GUITHDRAFT_138566 [Guillardia theta CCMP2712]|eukprot:XP_005833072.1 hypothetical protein GUITHDRAFT_138566 [Guillardia theta CCMP2712]
MFDEALEHVQAEPAPFILMRDKGIHVRNARRIETFLSPSLASAQHGGGGVARFEEMGAAFRHIARSAVSIPTQDPQYIDSNPINSDSNSLWGPSKPSAYNLPYLRLGPDAEERKFALGKSGIFAGRMFQRYLKSDPYVLGEDWPRSQLDLGPKSKPFAIPSHVTMNDSVQIGACSSFSVQKDVAPLPNDAVPITGSSRAFLVSQEECCKLCLDAKECKAWSYRQESCLLLRQLGEDSLTSSDGNDVGFLPQEESQSPAATLAPSPASARALQLKRGRNSDALAVQGGKLARSEDSPRLAARAKALRAIAQKKAGLPDQVDPEGVEDRAILITFLLPSPQPLRRKRKLSSRLYRLTSVTFVCVLMAETLLQVKATESSQEQGKLCKLPTGQTILCKQDHEPCGNDGTGRGPAHFDASCASGKCTWACSTSKSFLDSIMGCMSCDNDNCRCVGRDVGEYLKLEG